MSDYKVIRMHYLCERQGKKCFRHEAGSQYRRCDLCIPHPMDRMEDAVPLEPKDAHSLVVFASPSGVKHVRLNGKRVKVFIVEEGE